jgi:hypothetical protein
MHTCLWMGSWNVCIFKGGIRVCMSDGNILTRGEGRASKPHHILHIVKVMGDSKAMVVFLFWKNTAYITEK